MVFADRQRRRRQPSSSSLLADWNSYAASQSTDESSSLGLGFNLESAVRSTNDIVSGTFSVHQSETYGLFSCLEQIGLVWPAETNNLIPNGRRHLSSDDFLEATTKMECSFNNCITATITIKSREAEKDRKGFTESAFSSLRKTIRDSGLLANERPCIADNPAHHITSRHISQSRAS